MSLFNLIFILLSALVLVAFFWALRKPSDHQSAAESIAKIKQRDKRSVAFWPAIHMALSKEDQEFLRSRAQKSVQRHTRRDRQQIAMRYLRDLREDFNELLRLATVIAVLSPEVKAVHEWQRLRLTVEFGVRYHYVQIRLLCRASSFEQLRQLSLSVSSLMIELDRAMKELGEHAVLASELTSSLNSGGLRSV